MFHVISIFGFRFTTSFGYEIFEQKFKNPEITYPDFYQYLRRTPRKKPRNWYGDAQLMPSKSQKSIKD